MSHDHAGPDSPPRRGFLARLAAASVAFGLGGGTLAAVRHEPERRPLAPGDPDHWLDGLHGKHRQVFDAVTPNGGYAFVFANVFLDANNRASGVRDDDLGVVIVLRHEAVVLALGDALWAKYHLGEAASITDPATREPAVRNLFYHPHEGDLRMRGASIDALQARGVIVGVCGTALRGVSRERAEMAGMTRDAAADEWVAGVLPGITVLPAGVWGVNRAQERGCTYCFAG